MTQTAQLPGWNILENHHLGRSFPFPDFLTALDFVNRAGAIAEKQGHHPDLHLSWGRVDVETWSHDAGGITDQDFLLAASIDKLL